MASVAATLSAAVAGALAGAVAGAGGSIIGTNTLPAAIAISAIAGLALVDSLVGRVPILQRDAETPYSWLQVGQVRWAIQTGAVLGTGVFTRLGFIAWYLIPLLAFSTASAWQGSVIWGLYGGARVAASAAVNRHGRVRSAPEMRRRLTVGRVRARYLTDAVAIGIAFLAWFG